MIVTGHGFEKFGDGHLIATSAGRNWRNVCAELRAHGARTIPPYVPIYTEIVVPIRGRAIVSRQSGTLRQSALARPGTVWLCPAGLREDRIDISDEMQEVMHIYLLPNPFQGLSKHTSRTFSAESVRYESGFQDPILYQVAKALQTELLQETSCGGLLAESLSDALAIRLFGQYSSFGSSLPMLSRSPKELEPKRLRRVIEFIEVNLENDITVQDLASAASLSRFHFSRVFKKTTGKSPNRFIGERRLVLAKELLDRDAPISDVAFACRFSSQSNFIRAFRRSTGLTPGQYRDRNLR